MNSRFVVSGSVCFLVSALLAGCGHGNQEEAPAGTEVSVQVGKIKRVTLRALVDAYGTIEGEPAGGGKPAGAARLSATAAGVVMSIPAKEGDRVESGAVIVKLDDRVAVAQLEKARHAVEFAEQQMARQNKLKTIEGTSEKVLQETAQQLAAAKADLAAAQAQLALVQLASPLAGVVTRINVQPGQAVEPNTVVAEVVDRERLVASLNVPATESQRLKAGQPAELLVGSSRRDDRQPAELLVARGDDVAARGKVLYVAPQVESTTDTVLVRVSVPADAGLRSGQFVHARIISEERVGRLAVPREAVYTDHDGQSTLSVVEGDKAFQKVVKTGLVDGGLVEVEGEGIAEGATVVTLGSYALPKETKVRIIEAGDKGTGAEESRK